MQRDIFRAPMSLVRDSPSNKIGVKLETVSNVTDAISLSHPQEQLDCPAQLSKL